MTTPGPFQSTLAAAQAGAEWAVAQLYRDHNPALERYLRRQEPVDYADIASDTWLDVARNLRAFTGDADGFAGWVFTIMRRRLIDHRRARQRRPARPAPSEVFERLASSSAEQEAWDSGLGDDELRRILALLPEAQAEVILLRVIGGFDVEAVAGITGRSAGTIRVMQHRGLRTLAKKLHRLDNERRAAGDGTGRDAHTPTPPR